MVDVCHHLVKSNLTCMSTESTLVYGPSSGSIIVHSSICFSINRLKNQQLMLDFTIGARLETQAQVLLQLELSIVTFKAIYTSFLMFIMRPDPSWYHIHRYTAGFPTCSRISSYSSGASLLWYSYCSCRSSKPECHVFLIPKFYLEVTAVS